MNTRLIGKIFIGLGIILLILYIVWIVFRVVKQPEQVEQGGLLPNPFDLLLPGERPGTGVVEQITNIEEIEGLQIEDIVTAPDKRLFRISDSPALAFTLLEDSITTSSIDPATGEKVTETTPSLTVRYVTRDEGFVNDAVVESTRVTTTRKSSAFIPGLYFADISRYGMVGEYSSPGTNSTTSFSLLLENPVASKNKVVEDIKECSFDPVQVKLGESSRDIEILQNFLTTYGISELFEPGVFDNTMKSAVIEYQKRTNISPAEGFIGPKTVAQISKDCIEIMPKITPPLSESQQEYLDRQKISLLPRGIHNVSIVNDTQLFMILNSGTRNRGVLRLFGTEQDREVYTLPYVNWNIDGISSGDILMTTKASGRALGHVFKLTPETKSFIPQITGMTGLSITPSSDGELILYSSTEGGKPSLSLYNSISRETTPLNIETFAEKCSWGAKNAIYCFVPESIPDNFVYPDEWYKRGTDLRDSLIMYAIDSGSFEQIDDQNEIPAINADIIESAVTSSQRIIVFRDWNTGYIWGYKLK